MARYALKSAWHYLTRLNVAAVLMVILLLLAALGSCFPQLRSSIAADAERLADWETSARTRYGALTDLLAAIKVFSWFRSPVFLVSLALLTVATLLCTLDRWRAVWRRASRLPAGSSSDLAFDAAPHTAKLIWPSMADFPDIVRERLERRGFRVHSKPVGDVVYLRGDRNRLPSLATLVTHLAALLLLLGTMLSSRLGWREEMTIGPDETARIGQKSQLMLRNEGLAIGRYLDGSVSTYQAQVAIIEDGQKVKHGSVQVNRPLKYSGVGLYLQGYAERGSGYSVTLLAVHDPGYGLVITAGFLLLLGLSVSFNLPRSWIQARIEPGEMVRLAGWAERQACDFEREFMGLVWELGRLAEIGPEKAD